MSDDPHRRAGAPGLAAEATDPAVEEVIDAVMSASRVLVAVAARSLATAGHDDVSLTQYRVLVVLASRGPQRLAELAAALDVNPSTATRVCDRLAAKRLVRRRRSPGDRREVRVALTQAGRALVDHASVRRRAEIAGLLAELPESQRTELVRALRAFAAAAGEVPERDWALDWG